MKQLLIACSMLYSIAQAQLIKPGTYAGNIKATDVLQYDLPELKLSDFKGRVIILNFWNQSCISCIQNFAKYEALQQQYRDKIQIIMLCKEDKDSTLRFFAKRKKIIPPAVPLITNAADTWYKFNKEKTPYQVWMDDKGVVKKITASAMLNERNINALINAGKLVGPDVQKETLTKTTQAQTPIAALWKSSIAPYDPSQKMQWNNKPVNNGLGLQTYLANTSIVELFQVAYRELNKYDFGTPGQLMLDIPEPQQLLSPVDAEEILKWNQANKFCYELIIPPHKKEQRDKYIQQDLSRFFGLTATVEKRKITCIALVKKGAEDKWSTKGGTPIDELRVSTLRFPVNDSVREFKNKPLTLLVEKLNGWIRFHKELPFVDKTGIAGNIDITFREEAIDPFNYEKLQEDLQKAGLDLILSEDLFDVLVIKKESSQ